MNNPIVIKPCLLQGENDLPIETPIYKYLSIEAFLYLLEFRQLTFSRITNWPDAYEGSRFEFFKKVKTDQHFADKEKEDFYASCWSLQFEDLCLYENSDEHQNALDELQRNGSASMWESYCKTGGVRVKTTLGKMNNLLENNLDKIEIFRGKVYYEPAASWNKTIKTSELITTLLMKRVSFRHESEYRYILVPEEKRQESIITVSIDDLFEFFDEILISPAITSSKWISRTLYNIAVGLSIDPNRSGINHKSGNQFCKISQLYGLISETIGHYDIGYQSIQATGRSAAALTRESSLARA